MGETVTLGQVYECHNSSCTLGSRKQFGRFTDGMRQEGLELLYGTTTEEEREAEGIGWGEGYCPNCGTKGTPAEVEGEADIHESIVGDDPYHEIHKQVKARVLDEDDTSVTKENAQHVFLKLVDGATETTTVDEQS